MKEEYRYIYLPSRDYIQIKFDIEGVIYDRFNKDDEHQESYGYDLYSEINNLKEYEEIEEKIIKKYNEDSEDDACDMLYGVDNNQ